MAGAVRGLNIVVATQSGQVLGGQRGATLNRSSETLDVSNKATAGGWKEYINGAKEWSIECEGIFIDSDEALTALDKAFVAGTPVQVKIGKSGDSWGFKGDAIITEFPLEAPYDDALTYSITLQGTGALAELSGRGDSYNLKKEKKAE